MNSETSKKSLPLSRVVEAHTGGMLRNAIKNANKMSSSPGFTRLTTGSKPGPGQPAAGLIMTDSSRAEMMHLLLETVSKVSRQKMRFILMSLRQRGGIDTYMSYGDLAKILQDNGLVIPIMASGMILTACSDQLGIDSEKVWNLLMDVHSQSDRDSVRARKGMYLRTPVISVFADHGGDREILERMEAQFLSAPPESTFDFTAFKNAVMGLDKNRQGYVANTQLLKVCREYGFPVQSDLLKSLLIRCDDDNNGKISHREFFVLVDKAFENAIKVNPRLFAKKEEPVNVKKKQADAGRLLNDGVVSVVKSRLSPANSAENASSLDADDGAATQSETITDVSSPDPRDGPPDFRLRKASLAANSIASMGSEDGSGKPKGRLGKMKGFLGGRNKKGGLSGADSSAAGLDVASDNVSLASSIFSTISKSASLYQRGDLSTGANGLVEKPIHPVVRKIGEHKLVLWPPDEYFDTITPKIRLPNLEWIYGYSGFAHRNNIHFLSGSASLVYFVGQIVVLYNINGDSQRHYCQHDGLIQSIAVTKDGTVAATGQSPASDDQGAQIRVWTTENLTTLHVFKSQNPNGSVLQVSVAALCFTRDEDALVAIDEGKPRSLSVWSMESGQLLTSKPCTESPVVCGILSLRTSTKDPLYIIYGRGLMEVWRIVPMEKRIDFVRQCIFGQIPKPSIVTCIIESLVGDGSHKSSILSADSDGNIILWSEEMRPKTVLQNGNKVPVFTLCSLSPTLLMSGSRDGQISILHLTEDPIRSTKARIPEQYGGLRMLVPLTETESSSEPVTSSVVVGTTGNSILRLRFMLASEEITAEKHELSVVTLGHFDQVGSLSTLKQNENGGQSLSITAGMDGNINCVDLANHKAAWRVFLKDSMVTAMDCYPPFLAVGTSDAKLKLFQLTQTDLSLLLQANVGKGKVSCIKFSPDGTRLAVATQDSEIYMYKFSEGNDMNITIVGKFDKHDFPPVSIDWSRNPARDDHHVINSNSYEFENFLWDAESMDYLEEAHFYRNIKWFSQSCVLGFPAATSVTSENTVDSHVVCTDVTPTFDMVAAVVYGQKGHVGLFSYPNANTAIVKHIQPTYSSAVSAVRFCYVNNRLYLLCAHGQDGSLSQWLLR